jgi:hypothetical protein
VDEIKKGFSHGSTSSTSDQANSRDIKENLYSLHVGKRSHFGEDLSQTLGNLNQE